MLRRMAAPYPSGFGGQVYRILDKRTVGAHGGRPVPDVVVVCLGDHAGLPLQHHIEYHDVSWRADVILPYNGLSIGMRNCTGRPRGVAPTVSRGDNIRLTLTE